MTRKDNGGPAFPGETVVRTGLHSTTRVNNGGMTLRDWFAGQALAGYFAYYHAGHQNTATIDTAKYMYQMADAMLSAREAKP
jgi:hypothetical protein